MKRFVILTLLSVISVCVWAETPIERLIVKYDDMDGVRSISASGKMMKFARPMLKRYPIGLLSDKISEVYVLKMERSTKQTQDDFLKDMNEALAGYVDCGESDSPNGVVEVYALADSSEHVTELVVFNPELFVLNLLKGDFSKDELLMVKSVEGTYK